MPDILTNRFLCVIIIVILYSKVIKRFFKEGFTDMPNVNFTSSSIAQQDRFAQTTVSYESRHMQSIPFYPDVDHKAKFRGIFAMTFIISVVVGALFGLVYGFRDVLFQAATSIAAPAVNENGDETSAVPEAIDEKIAFSLAADEENPWLYVANSFDKVAYTVSYTGSSFCIPGWNEEVKFTNTAITGEYEYVFRMGVDSQSAKELVDENHWPVDVGKHIFWPKDVGKYTVWVSLRNINTGVEFNPVDGTDGKRFIYITKASIDNFVPAITISGLKDVYDPDVTLSAKDISISNISEIIYPNIGDTVKFAINYKAYGAKDFETVDKIHNAGSYRIDVTIGGTENVKEAVHIGAFEFEIAKADIPKADLEDAAAALPNIDDAIYDGEAKAIALIEDKLPDLVKKVYNSAIAKVYTYRDINGIVNQTDVVNVGRYLVSLAVSHQNYNDFELDATLDILPADLRDYFTFNNVTVGYTGAPLSGNHSALNISKDAKFPKYISVVYDYEAMSGSTTETGITPANIVKVGTYRIVAKFSYNDINAPKNFTLPEDGTVVRTLTVKKGDIALSNITVKPFTATYTGNAIYLPKGNVTVTGIPAGENIIINVSKASAIDAGTHEVEVIISGANYNATSTTATIVIEKAPFGSLLNLKYNETQTVKKNGKHILPEHSEIKFASGFQPVDLKIDYLVDGKSVTEQGGVDRLGNYKIDLIVSDKNHESKFSFDLTIVFNPMSIVFGLVLGVIAGILISVLIWLSYRKIEEASYKSFKGVRLRLLHERGGDRGAIVCEGRVTIINWNSEQEHRDFPWIVEPRFGRLFLTHATLEYYDSSCSGGNFKTYKNYRNFLIQLKEVTGVEIRGAFLRNKLIVFARGARHVFYVEPNTAYLWRRDIMHFRDLAHLYPMENNVVDNNYPFNYALVEQKAVDPNVPRNV